MACSALIFLASFSWLVLQPDMSPTLRSVLRGIDFVTWASFVLDYLVRLRLSRFSGSYFLRHLPDLLTVVVPVLRPLRLLRLVVLLQILHRHATTTLRGRVELYVAASTVLVLYSGALAALDAERGRPGANIEDFGTALWWAVTTITSVGYGDHYPVTTAGRFVAAALMIAGVGLLGAVTAAIASWLVGQVRDGEPETSTTAAELARLQVEIRTLRETVRHQSTATPGRTDGDPGPDPS